MFLQLPRFPQRADAEFTLESAGPFGVEIYAGGKVTCKVEKLVESVKASLVVNANLNGAVVANPDYGPEKFGASAASGGTEQGGGNGGGL